MKKRLRDRIVEALLKNGRPRLHMTCIIILTAGVSFLAARYLFLFGIELMALRFPMALAAGYIVFLMCLFLLTKYHAPDFIIETSDESDLTAEKSQKRKSPGVGDVIDVIIHSDDTWPITVLLVTVFAILIAVALLIYNAPLLIAELVFESILVVGFYKKITEVQARAWLRSALSLTGSYFLFVIIMSSLTGLIIQQLFPSMNTLGDLTKAIL